jgi:hypothetical protein
MKKLLGIFLIFTVFIFLLINFTQGAPPKKEECLTCHTDAKTLEKLMPPEKAAAKEGGGEG